MEKHTKRLILLFSLILVVIPMVIFPRRLGMPLISGSAVYMLYEFIFYGAVLYLFRRQTRLVTVMTGAALTLVYRMALGAVFGLTIAVMYKLNTTIAFSLGMAKYLPAILLHVVAAPFVLRTAYINMADSLSPVRPVRRTMRETETKPIIYDQETSPAPPPPPRPREAPAVIHTPAPAPVSTGPAPSRMDDDNQFERAVTYIGESGSVQMALVVDEEGLPLARFSRCREDYELWAPLAIVLETKNRALLDRYHRGGIPDKIDIGTGKMRIILRRIEHVTLMVLTDKNVDETILIRIAQAADMVRKYVSERYSPALFARVEEHYVSNT